MREERKKEPMWLNYLFFRESNINIIQRNFGEDLICSRCKTNLKALEKT